MTASTFVGDLLTRLNWSTSQADAALDGASASCVGLSVADCPFPMSSTLAHPWRAGWVATSASQAAPPTLIEARRTGHLDVVLKAYGSAATLAVNVHAELLHHPSV